MIFVLTIDGVPKQLKERSLRILQAANGRATASFTVLSEDRSYRPAIRDRVIMTEDGVTIFSGPIERVSERGMFRGSHPGIQLVISAADNNVYAERRYITEALPAGTLKAALQAVEPYFDPYGITLDPTQVDGPMLPALDFDLTRADEFFNQLATLTADAGEPYAWDFTATGVYRMFQPSTEAAPFDLVGNDLPEVIGDVEVDTTLNPGYANKVIIKLAPKREVDRTESWTYGTDPYPFQIQYTVESHYGHLTLSTGGGELMGYTGTTPTQWELDPVTNTLTRTAGTPTTGTVYTMMFTGSFSGVYEATDPEFAYDPWERVIVVDSIPDGVTGQAFADAELAKRLTETKTARYSTWEQGISAGQSQTINVSARATNATSPKAMLSEVEIRDLVHRLDRRVTAITDSAGTNLGRGFRDVYKAWIGDKGGGATTAVNTGAGVGSIGPAPPFQAVQYNNNGSFGGDADFVFTPEHSLACGEGSTVDALADSCQALGSDTHIEGPTGASLVAHTIKASSDGDTVTTDPINTVGATFIVMCVSQYSSNEPMSDSEGNTWSPLGATSLGFFGSVEFYICLNPDTSPTHTFSCTPATTGERPSLAVQAWAGITAYESDAAQDLATQTTTSISTHPLTPDAAGTLLIAALSVENTDSVSVAGPWTKLGQVGYNVATNASLAHAWMIAPNTSAVDSDWSWATSTSTVAAVILAMTAGGAQAVIGSAAIGSGVTVQASRAVAVSLDGNTANVHNESGVHKVFGHSSVTGYIEVEEGSAPSGVTNKVRVWAEDNGSGKTRLMAQFPTGAAVQIAIEP